MQLSIFQAGSLLKGLSSALLLSSIGSVSAAPAPETAAAGSLSVRCAEHNATMQALVDGIVQNIGVSGGLPGLAVASPSKSSPNYFYHWVRDGALTLSAILTQFEETGNTKYSTILDQYFESSAKLQKVPNRSGGVGEPKFNVDGTAFNGDWGRPQNDGPALRALVAMKTARNWSKDKQTALWNSLIKTDMDFVVGAWGKTGFDLWEELQGYHFFTALMQYGSLQAAAAFTQRAGMSSDLTNTYLSNAANLKTMITQKFLYSSDHIMEHSPANLGNRAGLDSASIIAVLEYHDLANWATSDSNIPPLMITWNDSIVKNTLNALVKVFTPLYPINNNKAGGIGRYSEDVYNGDGTGEGNPWFICTASVAEAYLRINDVASASNQIDFINKHRGDSISEEANRYTGYMQGAVQLTWSLSSVLRMTAVLADLGL